MIKDYRLTQSMSRRGNCWDNAVTEKFLADAVKILSHRPRKCLDYRTPHAVFQMAKGGAVAM